MNQITISETTDYKQFKLVKGNRPIHKPHLLRLRRSIMQRDMLAQHPIIVDEKMQVIDGQHRLEAAKELGKPIYYTFLEDASTQDVVLNNANLRQWTLFDYLEWYIAKGKEDYIILKEFANKHRLSVAICRRLLGGFVDVTGGRDVPAFRDGEFKIVDYDEADRLASLLSEVRKYSPDAAWKDRDCVKALKVVQEKIDPKLLISQLEKYQQTITRRNSMNDYLREFENIVNAGREGKQILLGK